jgi:hypothetical protein
MRISALVVCALVLVLGACGASKHDTTPGALGPNPTSSDPGPNSTAVDPGPNPTGGGPLTEDGTLQITARCLTLQRAKGPLDLRFHGYSVKGKGLADDTGTVLAHDGDHIAVAGREEKAKGPCGTRFDVESLVTVLPS